MTTSVLLDILLAVIALFGFAFACPLLALLLLFDQRVPSASFAQQEHRIVCRLLDGLYACRVKGQLCPQ